MTAFIFIAIGFVGMLLWCAQGIYRMRREYQWRNKWYETYNDAVKDYYIKREKDYHERLKEEWSKDPEFQKEYERFENDLRENEQRYYDEFADEQSAHEYEYKSARSWKEWNEANKNRWLNEDQNRHD